MRVNAYQNCWLMDLSNNIILKIIKFAELAQETKFQMFQQFLRSH